MQTFAAFGSGGTSDGGMLQFTAHERDANNVGDTFADLPDHFRARPYDGGLGRFLSVDPVINQKFAMVHPQAWNRYAYVMNNPINRTDPDGRCSKPAGAGGDTIGVCIDAFIAAARLKLVGLGDNRTFAANDPSKTSRVQVQMLVNTKTGAISAHTMPGLSQASVGPVLLAQGRGSASTSLTGATRQGDGTIAVTVQTTAANGLRDLPGAPKESIDFKMNLLITSDGRVGMAPGGRADGYPSLGVYGYSDQGTRTVWERREGSPADLAPPMEVVIPPVPPQ